MTDASKAIEFIKAIASNMTETKISLSSIIDVLNDGEALANLGVTDEDQELVELAHSIVSDWNETHDFLGQCQF